MSGSPKSILLLHGGAGPKPAHRRQLICLEEILKEGHALLEEGNGALEVVEQAIARMEDSRLFNAGLSGRTQSDGHLRLDASLMEGKGLRAGAVAGIERIRNPIRAARLVMERSPHVLMAGPEAARFSREHGLEKMSDLPGRRRKTSRRIRTEKGGGIRTDRHGFGLGTVGAVALDRFGTVAAGSSTGGVDRMLPGRVGDSPLVGSGIYADNRSGAVSMTGEGEAIIRAGLAREISLRMEMGVSPKKAAAMALIRMNKRVAGAAGALVLAHDGRFVLLHSTPHLIAGYRTSRRGSVSDRFTRI